MITKKSNTARLKGSVGELKILLGTLGKTRDSGTVEKGEIASSPRSSQRNKVRFQVIPSDSKNRMAISGVTVGLFNKPTFTNL